MKKKWISLLLTGLMAVSLLAGCGKSGDKSSTDGDTSSDDVVVINYPTFQCGVNTAAPVVAQLVEEFNEEYKGQYKIVLEEVPGDANYVDKIKVQLGTGDLPPVVYGGGYNLLDLALANDLVVDLTEVVNADSEWKGLYSDAALEANSRDGKIYASSVEGSVIGYFYNKDLFAEAGIEEPAKSWDEFFEQCDKLKAAGITPLAMDTADSAWVTQLWWGAMVATANEDGLKFMETMNPDDYNTPEMIASVEKIQKMLQEYTTTDAVGGKYENAANNFLSGQVAMIANGPWMIGDFSDTDKTSEGFADKVGSAIYPDSFVYDAPIQGYFVTKQSDPKVEEAAIAMVKFFTSEHAQELGLESQGMVPAASSVEVSKAATEKYPLLAEFLDQTAEATVRSDNMQATMYSNLLDVVSQELPRLHSGELDAEAFCQVLTDAAAKNE
ncbi:ABC transporter substrate-binding protein [Ohessyouella blattaphilus]|uniref:ABC transporter substrate-binding protein n=1 Tax=Ohessyouella blattaphilus TaxID=2949333 RepID=A0ABT1EFM8_9FIRM|nr:ABC transporter substrate-binding protein [Ohessyouella blattaphilus]MCP1109510.1 ABC transporter substrate-binding protein [Ohessyouella blattaphilus]MCR8562904.1 ABC transporter substrate-binding protein [Ohessyouella blattaphilus]MDL2250103.1 ABC transporter substrate-binding protein [Lachnospiraceae bacterium OttesenSCG-928-J05]